MKREELKIFTHDDLDKKEVSEFLNSATKWSPIRYKIVFYTDDIIETKRKIQKITNYHLSYLFAVNEIVFRKN